jgi:outer membrane protein assembly factor BamB
MDRYVRRGLALGAVFVVVAAAGWDWPGFRGPNGSGVSNDRGLPVKWGPEENVAWKTELPGPGGSSPVICGDRVFLTCYTGYGLPRGGKGDIKDLRRFVLCLDRQTGKILWQREVETKLPENDYNRYISEHGYTSSTPVCDSERVYVFFGRSGVVAFDLDGKQLWQVDVGKGLNSWGSAASLLLYKDLLIVNAAVEKSSLTALDRKTGKEVWRTKGIRDNWSTPVIVEVPGGKTELVLNQGFLVGYDPDTGQELWTCDLVETPAAISSPAVKNGIVYAMGSGSGGRTVMAVRAGGKGDVTKTHVLWKQKLGANVPSPLIYGDYLYFASSRVACLKADTGQLVYQEDLYRGGRDYVSPVAGDGKVYVFTRQNGAYVLAAGPKFEQLAHNDLGDPSAFTGSPAISHGQIFTRSDRYAYCIGKK